MASFDKLSQYWGDLLNSAKDAADDQKQQFNDKITAAGGTPLSDDEVNSAVATGMGALGADNTIANDAEEAAHDIPVYHGTSYNVEGDIKPTVNGKQGTGIYVSEDPKIASRYAQNSLQSNPNGAPNVMPMLAKGPIFNSTNPEHLADLTKALGGEPMATSKLGYVKAPNGDVVALQDVLPKLGYTGASSPTGTIIYNNKDLINKYSPQGILPKLKAMIGNPNASSEEMLNGASNADQQAAAVDNQSRNLDFQDRLKQQLQNMKNKER